MDISTFKSQLLLLTLAGPVLRTLLQILSQVARPGARRRDTRRQRRTMFLDRRPLIAARASAIMTMPQLL